MKYLVSKCDYRLIGGDEIKCGVKYIFEERFLHIVGEDNIPRYVDSDRGDCVVRVNVDGDEYYFLDLNIDNKCSTAVFKYQNNIIAVSILDRLSIVCNGEVLLYEDIRGVEYSHFEISHEKCFIYFKGIRDYVVILKGREVLANTYFDEYNEESGERYYLYRLHDSLNHGRVYHVSDKGCEDYLVYLDEEELNLNEELVGEVFLDCVMSGNLKYANQMMMEDIRQDDPNRIKSFFKEFDYYYPISREKFVLTKKNTLAGIYQFQYSNLEISNIIELK